MIIDIELLKEDLKNELQGAFYGGGFGASLIESFQIDTMNEEEIINLALKYRFNLDNYKIENTKKNKRR